MYVQEHLVLAGRLARLAGRLARLAGGLARLAKQIADGTVQSTCAGVQNVAGAVRNIVKGVLGRIAGVADQTRRSVDTMLDGLARNITGTFGQRANGACDIAKHTIAAALASHGITARLTRGDTMPASGIFTVSSHFYIMVGEKSLR